MWQRSYASDLASAIIGSCDSFSHCCHTRPQTMSNIFKNPENSPRDAWQIRASQCAPEFFQSQPVTSKTPVKVTVWLSSICKLQLKVSLNWTCIFGEHLHYTVSRCHSNKAVPLILRGIPWRGWINLSEQKCSKGRTATLLKTFLYTGRRSRAIEVWPITNHDQTWRIHANHADRSRSIASNLSSCSFAFLLFCCNPGCPPRNIPHCGWIIGRIPRDSTGHLMQLSPLAMDFKFKLNRSIIHVVWVRICDRSNRWDVLLTCCLLPKAPPTAIFLCSTQDCWLFFSLTMVVSVSGAVRELRPEALILQDLLSQLM